MLSCCDNASERQQSNMCWYSNMRHHKNLQFLLWHRARPFNPSPHRFKHPTLLVPDQDHWLWGLILQSKPFECSCRAKWPILKSASDDCRSFHPYPFSPLGPTFHRQHQSSNQHRSCMHSLHHWSSAKLYLSSADMIRPSSPTMASSNPPHPVNVNIIMQNMVSALQNVIKTSEGGTNFCSSLPLDQKVITSSPSLPK